MTTKLLAYTLPEIIKDRLTKLNLMKDRTDDDIAAYEICRLMFGERRPVQTFLSFCIDTLETELELLNQQKDLH